jgi:microtubule-associated protein-like 1/2
MVNGKWKMIDTETKKVLDECQEGNESIQAIILSPNGAMLAIGTKPGIIHLYQVSEDGNKFSRMGRCMADAKKQRSASTGSPISFVVIQFEK